MKKTMIILGLILGSTTLFGQRLAVYDAYIERYKEIAISQQIEYGIPASITMAQGLLESGAGQSELAVEANNHFGIKCTSDWTGETYFHDDDKAQECFRKYSHAEQSFLDHSKFLRRPRYSELFTIPVTNYGEWAHGLSRCGYATDPNYPDKLIKLIQDYELDKLAIIEDSVPQHQEDTVPAFGEMMAMQSVGLYHEHKSGYQHGNRYILAEEGESFASLAYFLNISEKSLRKFNDAADGRELKAGDRVYLYPKPRRAPRKYKYYWVRPGETAWFIAQKLCFQMRTLYELNGIPYGTPLTTRQELRLR